MQPQRVWNGRCQKITTWAKKGRSPARPILVAVLRYLLAAVLVIAGIKLIMT
jgi:hypothetical protein